MVPIAEAISETHLRARASFACDPLQSAEERPIAEAISEAHESSIVRIASASSCIVRSSCSVRSSAALKLVAPASMCTCKG